MELTDRQIEAQLEFLRSAKKSYENCKIDYQEYIIKWNEEIIKLDRLISEMEQALNHNATKEAMEEGK